MAGKPIKSGEGVRAPIPTVFSRPTSRPGLWMGVLVFATSLFPSLLPKLAVTQGVVSAISFMVGYGLGAGWQWVWNYLELRTPSGRWWGLVRWTAAGLIVYAWISATWSFVGWQNDLRNAFGMSRLTPMVWLAVIPVAAATAFVILISARSIRALFGLFVQLLRNVLPARLSRLLGGISLVLVLWGLWSGVLVNSFFAVANQIFATRDVAIEEGVTQPDSDLRSGSSGSLVDWETLGVKGRTFVATGPGVEDLNAFHGSGAVEPIRVYVGLKSADTVEGRAQLLLDELIRTDAFARSVLVVATTTGTGFLEPNAMTVARVRSQRRCRRGRSAVLLSPQLDFTACRPR